MAFIGMVSDSEAFGPVAELYETDRMNLGYVANHTRIFAHRPAVYDAWQQLRTAITEGMDRRRYELVTVAAAPAPFIPAIAHSRMAKCLQIAFWNHRACARSSPTTVLPDWMLWTSR